MRSSSCHLFASIFNSAAATFSSRCSTLEVPGIGSMTGDRASSHARATWEGVAFHRAAIRLIGLLEPETRPAASGNHGIKPIFSLSQYSRTSSDPRSVTLNDSERSQSEQSFAPAESVARSLPINRCVLLFLALANPSECRADLQPAPSDRFDATDKDQFAPGATGAGCLRKRISGVPAFHFQPIGSDLAAHSRPWWRSPAPSDTGAAPQL